MRILVVRNDKLGDFMLAWPVFALLKHHWPEAHISALVPAYTEPMARLCPWIDEVLIEQRKSCTLADLLNLHRQMTAGQYAAILTLFSTGRVGLATWLAGIPYRLAPATKLAQLCYNQRLTQRRSRSEKPEYAYNLDLGYRLLHDLKHIAVAATSEKDGFLPAEIKRPLLQFDENKIKQLRTEFCDAHQLTAESLLIFIHPGSGGSANNLSPTQYAALANSLQSRRLLAFVITAGPGEEEVARQVCQGITAHPAIVLQSREGLVELTRHLAFSDLFISGSTGPLLQRN